MIDIKLRNMYDKAVDISLPTLEFTTDWFVKKMIEKFFTALFADDSILFNILAMSHLQLMTWVFFVQVLIILTAMMLVFMKKILKLLFMSDF